jgi:hypothetical protein
LLCFAGLLGAAAAPPIQTQNAFSSTGASLASTAFSTNPVIGRVSLVACVVYTASSTSTISFTDNYSNSYTTLSSYYGSSSSLLIGLGYAPITATGTSFAPTCHYTANTATYITVISAEYAGLSTGSLSDGVISAPFTTASATCGTLTTTNPTDLLLLFVGSDSAAGSWSITPPTGFTVRNTRGAAAIADRDVTSTGSYDMTFTGPDAGPGVCMAVGLKASVASSFLPGILNQPLEY